MKPHFYVVDRRNADYAFVVKVCWTYAGAVRWVRRRCGIRQWFVVEYR